MDYRKNTFGFLALCGCICCLLALGLYIYDPFSFFGQNRFNKGHFQTDDKYGLPAIVKNNWGNFQSAIIGTSMLRSTNGKELDTKDDKYANLSVDRFNVTDRKTLFEFLYAKKKLKNVLYSLDLEMIFVNKKDPKYKIFYGPTTINKLYESLSFYISNGKYLLCLLSFSKSKKCIGNKLNLAMPQATTYPMAKKIKLQHILDTFDYAEYTKYFDPKRQKSLEKLKLQLKYYEDKLFSVVKAHHDTNFSIIIPPYSMLFWRLDGLILDRLVLLKMILKEGEKYGNLKFYYFQNESFTKDYKNFAYDAIHHKHFINSIEVKAIQNKTNLINTHNFTTKIGHFLENVEVFDLDALKKDFIPSVPKYTKNSKPGFDIDAFLRQIDGL